MYALMYYQMTPFNERIIAYITTVWSFSSMYALMPVKRTLYSVGLVTYITAV